MAAKKIESKKTPAKKTAPAAAATAPASPEPKPTPVEVKAKAKAEAKKLAMAAHAALVEEADAEKRGEEIAAARSMLLAAAKSAGIAVEETTAWFKLTGAAEGKKVYISKKGARMDLSGFTVTHPVVVQVTEEVAKANHMGKVRGHIDFSVSHGAEAALAAFAELGK